MSAHTKSTDGALIGPDGSDLNDRANPARYTPTGVMLRQAAHLARMAQRLDERSGRSTPRVKASRLAVPRITRSTRTARITTTRRVTTMAASSSSGGDDSGGDQPSDPAPLGAEGRATECPLNLGPELPEWFTRLWDDLAMTGGLPHDEVTEGAMDEVLRLALGSWRADA